MKKNKIIELYLKGLRQCDIARTLGVSDRYVRRVVKGLREKGIMPEPSIKEIEAEIEKAIVNGEDITEEDIADKYGIPIKEVIKMLVKIEDKINKQENEKKEIIEKQLKKIAKKEKEEEHKKNIIYELLAKSVQRFEPPEVRKPVIKKSGKRNLIALLCLSDWHIGEIIDAEAVNYLNKFDEAIATARLELLVEKVLYITELQRTHSNINELIVWLGGDMISGIIHDELRKNANLGEIKQVALAGYLIAQVLAELSTDFDKIKIITSVGNHGRLDKKKEFKNPYNSFDFLAYQISAMALNNYKNLDFHISTSMIKYQDIKGWQFVFSHGDEIRGWSGIPFYGLERSFRAKQSMYFLNKEFTKPLDYMVVGHFHIGAEIPSGHGKIFMNGSLKGIDEYAFKNGWVSRPSQKLIFIDEDKGVIDSRDIWLDEKTEPERYNYNIPDVWSEFIRDL